jgi:hemoglobin
MSCPRPNPLLRALGLALCLAAACSAPPLQAQPAGTAPKVPVFAPDPGLLADFGGAAGLAQISHRLVEAARADPRIGHHFEKTKLPELKKQLADQFCQVLAGPCVYEGDTMKASHADLAISRADFLALVELLQDAMQAQGVPFRAQNQLLARLAPMHRDIITR